LALVAKTAKTEKDQQSQPKRSLLLQR